MQLHNKAMVNFKIYGVINWETNNYNICNILQQIQLHILFNILRSKDGKVNQKV